jgi:hypothetical protein
MAKKKEEYKRMSAQTLQEAMHTIFPNKGKPALKGSDANEIEGVTYYTVNEFADGKDKDGNATLSKDSVDAYAQKKVGNGIVKYFVKFDGQSFYNPVGLYSGSERGAKKVPGLQKWRYTSVNKNVFTSYLRFLKTKNASHLQHALREFV